MDSLCFFKPICKDLEYLGEATRSGDLELNRGIGSLTPKQERQQAYNQDKAK